MSSNLKKNKKNAKKPFSQTNPSPDSQRQARLKVNADLMKSAHKTAHAIVLDLLETGVSKEFFLEKIRYITPNYYEDIITERSLEGICGYPLCNAVLVKMFNNQTYIIRHNKVYDITQRHHYCSDKCYEASELVMKQIPVTPLYLRSTDTNIKNFQLVLPDLTQLKGRYGTLVNITGALDGNESPLNKHSISLPHDTLNPPNARKAEEVESYSAHTGLDTSSSKSPDSSVSQFPTDDENVSRTSDSSASFGLSPSQTVHEDSSFGGSTDSESQLSAEAHKLSLDGSSSPETRMSSAPLLVHRGDGKLVAPASVEGNERKGNAFEGQPSFKEIYELEDVLRQWMTFDSLRLILGDTYVRGMLEELGQSWEDYDTTAGLRLGIEAKMRYADLCRRLEEEERREEALAEAHLTEADAEDDPDSPSPDFERLKKEVDENARKVKAFYEGREDMESGEVALETIFEEGGAHLKGDKRQEGEDAENITLPLVDACAQKAWRRQIVLEKLTKPVSQLCFDLGLDQKEVLRLVNSLVTSFDLSARNISLLVKQWKIVALVLVKMLSVRYPAIEEAILPGSPGLEHITAILRDTSLDSDYLNRLLSYLTEISYILTKYHGVPSGSSETLNQPHSVPASSTSVSGHGGIRVDPGCISKGSNPGGVIAETGLREDKSNEPYTNYEELD